MNHNPQILNYHDAVLYQSDLNILLHPQEWLNDACIHFALTRLDQQLQQQEPNIKTTDSAGDASCKCKCKFLDPSVLSFFMHQWDEEEDGDEDVLGLKLHVNNTNNNTNTRTTTEKVLFFLPINDNYTSHQWKTPGGGTHWSLLLLIASYNNNNNNTLPQESAVPCSTSFWHFDSSTGSGNQRAAKAVADKLQRVLRQWRWQQATPSTTAAKQHKDEENRADDNGDVVQECAMPQQQNGYDCGLHTLATAKALAKAFVVGSATHSIANKNKESLEAIVQQGITSSSFCAKLRKKMAEDVQQLMRMHGGGT